MAWETGDDRKDREGHQHHVGFAQLEQWPTQHPQATLRPAGRGGRSVSGAALDPVLALRCLQPLKKGLVAAVVIQAEQGPARRDQETGFCADDFESRRRQSPLINR